METTSSICYDYQKSCMFKLGIICTDNLILQCVAIVWLMPVFCTCALLTWICVVADVVGSCKDVSLMYLVFIVWSA